MEWKKIIFSILSLMLIASLIIAYYLNVTSKAENVEPEPVDWWFDVNVYAVGVSEENGTPTPNLVAAVNATVLVVGFNYTGTYDPDIGWRNGTPYAVILGVARTHGTYINGTLMARAHVDFTYYMPPSHYRFMVYIVAIWDGYYVVRNGSDYYYFNGVWGALYYTVYYEEWGPPLDGFNSTQEYIDKINQIELRLWGNRTTGFPEYDEILERIREKYNINMTFAVSPHEVNIYAVYPLNYTKMVHYQWPLAQTPGEQTGSLHCLYNVDWDETVENATEDPWFTVTVNKKIVASKDYAYPIFLFEGHTIANSRLYSTVFAGVSGRYTVTGGTGLLMTVGGEGVVVKLNLKSFGGKVVTWSTGGGAAGGIGEGDWEVVWSVGKFHIEVLYMEIETRNLIGLAPYVDLNPRWTLRRPIGQGEIVTCKPVWMVIASFEPFSGDAQHYTPFVVGASKDWKLLDYSNTSKRRWPFSILSNCSKACPELCRSYGDTRGCEIWGGGESVSVEWRGFNISLTGGFTVSGSSIEVPIEISASYWYAENKLIASSSLIKITACYRDAQGDENKTIYIIGSAYVYKRNPWQGVSEPVFEEGPLLKPYYVGMNPAGWQVVLWYIEETT